MRASIAGLLLLLAADRLLAHAIEAEVITGGIGIAARYADGKPAAHAEVNIFAPGAEHAFQQGFTDREGRFLFQPAMPGVWRVVIDDGMGHSIEQTLTADEKLTAKSTSTTMANSRMWRLIAGVGFIWGTFGTWGWWRARRR